MTRLASLPEFKAWLKIAETDEADDFKLELALDAASRWIEAECGRAFSLATAVTNEYVADDTGAVEVLDLVAPTSIKVDSNGNRTFATTLVAADYELLPRNGDRYGRIRIWPTSSRSFGSGRLVQVVGTFGYVENGQVPADVKLACMILATRYKTRDQAPFGILGATDLGQFERISKEDPDVMSLLEPYRAGSASGAWIVV